MREPPPSSLVDLLERLQLATRRDVIRSARSMRPLFQEIPAFKQAWVDALTHTRLLTPFQSAEIMAGRGEQLRRGPYLLYKPLPGPPYVANFLAKNLTTKQWVRLLLAKKEASISAEPFFVPPEEKSTSSEESPYADIGTAGDHFFVAANHVEGFLASETLIHHGRFPAEIVLLIARSMAEELAHFERQGICHGDIAPWNLLVYPSGKTSLLYPGIRSWFRPTEGYSQTDLSPEAYDYLAPERVATGSRPNIQSDLYACGCLWWHLLSGRTPLRGGSSIAKLHSAELGDIPDIRTHVHSLPAPLDAVLLACLHRDISKRPASMAALSEMLGPVTAFDQKQLASWAVKAHRSVRSERSNRPRLRYSHQMPVWFAVATVFLTTVGILFGSLWPSSSGKSKTPIESSPQTQQIASSIDASQDSKTTHSESNHSETTRAEAAKTTSHKPLSSPMHRIVDSELQPTSFVPSPPASNRTRTKSTDIELPTDRPTSLSTIFLKPDQRLIGRGKTPSKVVVPTSGLVVEGEHLCFENIHFISESSTDSQSSTDLVCLVLHAASAEFRHCLFQVNGTRGSHSSAIRWMPDKKQTDTLTSLPFNKMEFADCLFTGVGEGILCDRPGAISLDLTNSLYLGQNAFLKLPNLSKADEPLQITLTQTTFREAGPLLECPTPRIDQQPGTITICARETVFSLRPHQSLVSFLGDDPPKRFARIFNWQGEGSLISPQTTIAAWQTPSGRKEVLDDSLLTIAGLVRGEIHFQGLPDSQPGSSLARYWEAPLASNSPPGINPSYLPNP